MSAGEWTPGPWEWTDNALWGSEYGPVHAGKTCIECGHAPVDCGKAILGVSCDELREDGEDWHPSEADARLIAAAPDLLEALEEIVSGIDEADELHESGVAIDWQIVVRAKALIAKARGAK